MQWFEEEFYEMLYLTLNIWVGVLKKLEAWQGVFV
jgi:hypothetical protein